jgi:hypothetical protein
MTGAAYSHPVLLARVPAGGKHFRLEPDAEQRRAIAAALGLVEVAALSAEIEVRPLAGESYAVRGALTATVVQTDVVTLDPMRQEVSEAIDLALEPAEGQRRDTPVRQVEMVSDDAEDRDVYENGRIDLGAILTEHLALLLDPYPRAPGVEFPGHVEDGSTADSAFAALAALKDVKEKGG